MLEPFIWMFKTENFKKSFKYLLFIYLKFFVVAVIFAILGLFFLSNFTISIVLFIVAGIFLLAPALCIQGYFWELTANIISRDWDIKASSVYTGKIKEIFKIELPQLKTLKLIWRGMASIVATLLMLVPFIIITTTGLITTSFISPLAAILIFVFIFSFIPALLWNYAKQDSIFAVWNIRKAIYIMGNYTGKYIINTIIFILFYTLNSVVLGAVSYILGFNILSNADFTGFQDIIKLLFFYIASYLIYLYSIFVYAYLLGTLTPPAEG